jgi:hypothetical protein
MGGESLARDQDGTLYVAQSYGWANQEHLAVLVGDPGGQLWTRYVVTNTAYYLLSPRVAVWKGWVVLVWLEAPLGATLASYPKNDLFVSMSPDKGRTWTAPQKLNDTPSDRSVTGPKIEARDDTIAVVYAQTGGEPSWNFQGAWLTVFR